MMLFSPTCSGPLLALVRARELISIPISPLYLLMPSLSPSRWIKGREMDEHFDSYFFFHL